MSAEKLEMIKTAGVVGAGGAGFPAHVKLDAKVDTLIINAAECEPMINVDKQLLENYFEEIYQGIKIASELVGAKRIVVAIKEKNKKATGAIEDFCKRPVGFELFKLGDFYPAGDEQVLCFEITGKIVPEGGIPLQIGIVVINVETLFNISNAAKGISVTDKFVTINGEVEKPLTIKVPVGTAVNSLIEYCGGPTREDYAVIDGGPMMGKLVDPSSYSVKKTTKSILVLPEDNIVAQNRRREISADIKRAQAICLSCRMCTELCPRYLLGHDLFPDEMMKKMYRGELTDEDTEDLDFAWLCCDCGLCELYSCVVDLSARSLFNHIKDRLAVKGIKNPHNRSTLEVNDFRQSRKVPMSRLKARLEVDQYTSATPLTDFNADIKKVRLYLLQHAGVPSRVVVNEGQDVKKGELVADIPEGKLGARIHSSIDGKVKEIKKDYITITR